MKKAARNFVFRLILASFALGVFATAQQPKPAGRVMVHAGKLLDVRTGKTLNDQAIVIDGGKIVSVGPFTQASRSPDRSGQRYRSTWLDRCAYSHDQRPARCRL